MIQARSLVCKYNITFFVFVVLVDPGEIIVLLLNSNRTSPQLICLDQFSTLSPQSTDSIVFKRRRIVHYFLSPFFLLPLTHTSPFVQTCKYSIITLAFLFDLYCPTRSMIIKIFYQPSIQTLAELFSNFFTHHNATNKNNILKKWKTNSEVPTFN